MAIKKGTIIFQDYEGKTASVVVDADNLDAVEDLAETLKGYSRARIISASFSQKTLYDNNDDATGSWDPTGEHYDTVSQKCKLIYQDTETGDMKTLSIPAPNDNCFQANQQPSSDVAEDIADALAELQSSTYSMNLMYKGGGLTSKLPKSDRRSKTMTGV